MIPKLFTFKGGVKPASHKDESAGAPIRTVFIETNSLFLGKGYSFFKATTEPINFRFSAGEIFQPRPAESARELSRRLEKYFRERLGREGDRIYRIPQ